jgi:hypothetical protein
MKNALPIVVTFLGFTSVSWAWEQPELFTNDIRAAFKSLR